MFLVQSLDGEATFVGKGFVTTSSKLRKLADRHQYEKKLH